MKRLIIILVLLCSSAFAENFYISNAGGSVSCGELGTQTTQSPSWFNTAGNWANPKVAGKVGPDDTVYICGTITATSNTVALAAQNSGSSGHPITIALTSGAIVQEGYGPPGTGSASCGGIVCIQGLSYITLTSSVASSPGTIQNTANGTAPTYANQQPTLLVDSHNCQPGCTVSNLKILPAYVRTSTSDTAVNSTQILAILPPGTNGTVSGNTFDYCGWCLYYDWQNGDDTVKFENNSFNHFGHGMAIFTGGNNALTNLLILGNSFNAPGTTWDGSGCPNHNDGIHIFGPASGTNSLDHLYIGNNYFGGDWGACPTGFYFVEGAGNQPNVKNSDYFNNVHVMNSTGQVENTNGWIAQSSGISGTQRFDNNTFIGDNASNNGTAFVLSGLAGADFRNNVIHQIDNPICAAAVNFSALDYNVYGAKTCWNGNCFTKSATTACGGGVFEGSLAAWKTATGADTNSTQNVAPGLNADGTVQSGSALIAASLANLASISTGNLLPLASATTGGNSIRAVARPANGAGNWTIGAYNLFYTLTVTPAGSGTGTVTSADTFINCGATCSTQYNSGDSTTLTASAAGGSTFASWSGGICSGVSTTCSVTMNQTSPVTATFNSSTTPVITLSCSPTPVLNGSTTVCTWTVTGGPFSACSIAGIDITASCASGNHTFTVSGPTTYTLSARNSNGPSTNSFTVDIGGTAQGANTVRTSNTVVQ